MSDLENELLGLAEEDPRGGKRRRNERQTQEYGDDSEEEGEEEMDMDLDSDSDEEEESAPPPKVVAPPAAKKASKPRAPAPTKSAAASGSGKSGGRNPYPLEGQYVDEDDRDHLENLPEIEREAILAARAEEMQKFKDAQQLDAMFQGIGGAGEEVDEDDGPRKKRKHTSVTKEASRAMKDLRNKRKAMDERAARRAARREAQHNAPSDDESEEDGEISNRDSSRDQRSYRYSPEPSSSPQARKASPKQENEDATPPSCADLNGARLSRYEIVDVMFKDGFEGVAAGAFVRLMANERDEAGRPKYQIHRILEVTTTHNLGRYSIEYKDRQVKEDRALLCQYGKAKRLFRIADVSNSDFLETEFSRFGWTNQADGVKPPKRSELRRKHEQIKALRERPMTDEEINRQVENRKSGNISHQRSRLTIEIGNLMSSRNNALRQGDEAVVRSLEEQILKLGGDPETGELIGAGNGETYDERMERISENSKKRAKEHMAAAHIASIQQRRAQEALLRARQAEMEAAAAKPIEPVAPVVPPIKAMRKNETPQQFVARTVELDLGDF